MPTEPVHFDDPGLKLALRTLQANQKAPGDLRELLIRRLADERAGMASTSANEPVTPVAPRAPKAAEQSDRVIPIRRNLYIGRWLAAAAAIILCAGGTIGYLQYRQIREQREAYAKNDELLDAMIDVQQDSAKGESVGEAIVATSNDPAALSAAAQLRLGRTIPVVNLSNKGWTLAGASFCQVNNQPSVQFHFTRVPAGAKSVEHMTVLSMPASAWTDGNDGAQYDLLTDGHPIAGYIRSGSLNCVVGDTSLGRDEAVALRDAIRGG